MFTYYLDLALRSLKRNKVLTALMVLALALGIGASITTLTVLRLLSGDPLPTRSAQLFYPQVDPRPATNDPSRARPMPAMTWTDAMNLVNARKARYQAAMALTQAKVMPAKAGERPFFSDAVMTTADFFPMFDVPFRYGSGWSDGEGQARARVVVISDSLNQKLFAGANSVGRTLRIGNHDLRIVGVLRPWALQPRFYAVRLGGRSYGDGDGVFLPLQTAVADKMSPNNLNCYAPGGDLNDLTKAPCIWLGMWVDLPTAGQVRAYRGFLDNYVHQQVALGRMHRTDTALPGLMQWMRESHVVPDDVQLQTWLAFGFLLICVVNTVGLLLAKCLKRSQEIGVRRALGATRRTVFAQFMVEAGIIGLAGGLLGLVLAELGLWGIRHQPAQYAGLAHLDLGMFAFTFVVALLSSLIAGLLPAWRACVLAPAPQLKAS